MKMRRVLSFLVALGLAGVAPLPVSACALVSSQPSECANLQTKTECERMGMDQAEKPPVTVSNAGKNCCVVSEAPLPEAQTWTGSFSVATAPAPASSITIESTWFSEVKQDLSPPPLRSLLCTFLI